MLGERLGSMLRAPISCTNYPWLLIVDSRYITPNQAPVRILSAGGRGVGARQVANLIREANAFQRGPTGLGGNADLINVAAVVVAVNRGPAPALVAGELRRNTRILRAVAGRRRIYFGT